MKKFFMIAVMAVAALTASAQSKFHFTPHVGFGYANMSGAKFSFEGSNYKASSGAAWLVGAEAEYMATDNVGISLGVDYLFSQSDEQDIKNLMTGHTSGNLYYKYSYLNIPVLAQYHFGKLAVKAGIQPSIDLTAEMHDGHKGKADIKKAFNSMSVAMPVGVSYEFGLPIVLDLRCAIPLTKQNKEKFLDKDLRFTTVTLTAGYRF